MTLAAKKVGASSNLVDLNKLENQVGDFIYGGSGCLFVVGIYYRSSLSKQLAFNLPFLKKSEMILVIFAMDSIHFTESHLSKEELKTF